MTESAACEGCYEQFKLSESTSRTYCAACVVGRCRECNETFDSNQHKIKCLGETGMWEPHPLKVAYREVQEFLEVGQGLDFEDGGPILYKGRNGLLAVTDADNLHF